MFYSYPFLPQTAQLSRILAEDVLAPELRAWESHTVKSFKLRLPGRCSRQNEAHLPCACTRVCAAGSN